MATINARQRWTKAHGKESRHGNGRDERTAKKQSTTTAAGAHGKEYVHGKGAHLCRVPCCPARQRPLCRAASLCRAHITFFKKKNSVLFFLLLMFISQLVLYFVDYLLMLLNTMCIYPSMLFAIQTYTTTSTSPHIY
jgi:hypothetical protein